MDEVKAVEAVTEIKSLLEKQDAEIKKYGQAADKTVEALKAAEKKYDEQLAEKNEQLKKLETRIGEAEAKMNRPGFGAEKKTVKLTPGARFAMSEEYKRAQKSGSRNVDAFEVKDFFRLEEKLVVSDDPEGLYAQPERVPGIFTALGQRPTRLRDIMNVSPTGRDSIEFLVENTFDEDGARPQSAQGAEKKEGDLGATLTTVPIPTIPHWLSASRQVLSDAPYLQGFIDGRLLYSIEKELEDQILFGTGGAGGMTGIMNTVGVSDIGMPGDDDLITDHLRRAIRNVRRSEYQATGIILNPDDWAEIELQKGSDDHYIWVQVPNGGEMRLWRVPVIETTAMQQGEFLVGAFGLGAQLWDRQSATVRISEHHEDFFTRNTVAILAELRMVVTVYRPRAFCKGQLPEISSS